MFKELIHNMGFQSLSTISTVVFFVVFLGILLRVFLLRKDFTDKMGNLPLEDGEPRATSHKE
jgi:hypothetical protein